MTVCQLLSTTVQQKQPWSFKGYFFLHWIHRCFLFPVCKILILWGKTKTTWWVFFWVCTFHFICQSQYQVQLTCGQHTPHLVLASSTVSSSAPISWSDNSQYYVIVEENASLHTQYLIYLYSTHCHQHESIQMPARPTDNQYSSLSSPSPSSIPQQSWLLSHPLPHHHVPIPSSPIPDSHAFLRKHFSSGFYHLSVRHWSLTAVSFEVNNKRWEKPLHTERWHDTGIKEIIDTKCHWPSRINTFLPKKCVCDWQGENTMKTSEKLSP